MDGKVAIVTGSAQGIGKAIAQILLENKIKVCISDINDEVGRSTLSEFEETFGRTNVMFQLCDVTKDSDLEQLFKRTIEVYGRLDILVNNAGIVYENRAKLMMAINMTAMLDGTMMALQYMATDKGGKGGVVINISSLSGVIPVDPLPYYSASKHAVVGFSRALGSISDEVHGVRVNVICPVLVDTDMGRVSEEEIKKGRMYGPDAVARFTKHVQDNGGVIKPRDVAEGCLQLVQSPKLSGVVMISAPQGPVILDNLPEKLEEGLKIFTKSGDQQVSSSDL